ncbi:MAG: tRNA (guanine-N7-)-methyltransferase [Bacteroidia bacterium]|jgi:tRNA (guanine-N7-)-methyltransferase
MSRRKQKKFADNAMRHNIVQPGKPIYEQIKGKWNEYFENNNPIVLELACGRGEYSVGLAKVHPEKNFVGVDIKGDRIWVGSAIAIEEGLENVAFLRTHVLDLADFFAENEVSEIWVVHPDPRPRGRDEKRRLTHQRFMAIYKSLLKENGWLKFKTDSTELFDFTLEEVIPTLEIENFEFTKDLYNSSLLPEHHGIKTRYEGIFTEEGHDIKYMKFKFATNSKLVK